ncbi:MAG: NAD-dependent epimerase [Melioribacteraceae bacterium]|nr:NAD-dependent epimerase [Saprospiraceae bacterium]MCF8355755.1 NAD-dependent epimerase [Melioribacteraceae bacterium]MCF8394783.1 NAD-dependent epimerase [Melioribacteraceae bacterium]
MNKILVTGTAGFIGFHLVNKLLKETDWQIVGLDNINDYYDVNLKYARLKETGIEKDKIQYNTIIQSSNHPFYRFIKLDLTDKENLLKLFEQENFDYGVNLAAQAGVRYSLENPQAYIDSNINGFFNILEGCRLYPVKHLVYASSSSVYGNNKKTPFSESDRVDHPISLYAATKKSNELMAYTYSHLYNLPATGLRFFTVYGPWGRPDMAYFKFTKAILNDEPIDVYNNGNMLRDFTFIDDIVEGVKRVIKNVPSGKEKIEVSCVSVAACKIYNIGNSSPILLNDFIKILERALGKDAKINFLPLQPGDAKDTHSDVKDLEEQINYKPRTKIEDGMKDFIKWFKEFYFEEKK